MPGEEPFRTREEAIASMDFPSFPELFGSVGESALRDLETEFQRVYLKSGETLIRQGGAADCMYVLVVGRLRAWVRRSDGPEVVLGEVGRGEVVGEMGLLIDEPRSATIRAVRDSELLRLSRDAFDRFIERHPLALKQIIRVNLLRLRRTILPPRAESTVATIAVVPAGKDPPVSSFAETLARALGAIGPTLHLDKERFDRRPGANVTAWLGEQELKYRYVIYESDGTRSQWTGQCLRHADHVLAVGRGGSDPALGEPEMQIQPYDWQGASARRDLVLLHPEGTHRPSGTQAWLASRHVDGHHHIHMGSRTDYDRLARFLTGRAVGVVLGGGGARGMAHIGALRAIHELGIPIDLIGGTSSGAIFAGAAAKGLGYEEMLETARQRLVDGGSLLDFTLPFVSLVSGRRISKALHRTFEDLMIEDLWSSYFCVSSNLSRARMMVHRRGHLWKAIRASVSLPGILPPVLHDKDLLVDGGLMNRLPVDVMRGLCNGGRVLAVNVSTLGGLEAGDGFGEHLSGWRAFGQRINPFKARPAGPNIASILLCSTLLKSAQAQEVLEREADVCVQVPPPPIGLFDFRSLKAMVQAGYEAALKQLEGWPAGPPGPGASQAPEARDPSTLPILSEAFHGSR
jgi:NTE family protein/lysophospholipid hydrolase